MANKTGQQITEKYQRRMAAASPDYEAGVRNPSRPWEEATLAGEQRWQVGVQQAAANGAFPKGVRGKAEKWARKSGGVGVQRYQAAAQDAAKEYGAIADKIISITSSVRNQVRAMDNSTEAARENRMIENARSIKRAWKGS